MDAATEQREEREVLLSIYSGDEHFLSSDETTYQYRVESENGAKKLMLQVKWPSDYPLTPPNITLEIFYNNHIPQSIHRSIAEQIHKESLNYVGGPATYMLFEFVKENVDQLMADVEILPQTDTSKALDKERHFEERPTMIVEGFGDKARGWNWVDVMKHLSQTGPATKT